MDGEPFVVESESGAARWRAVSLPLADSSGSVTVAQDISGIDATVQRLALIELGIGTVVLALLGGLGWFLVRGSLRPLRDVERAAAVIAAGDLAHRAPMPDPRTEVGSLAHSFNTMVDAVSRAFDAQQESERAAVHSAETARASEARMRQFVADASHELRTPLTSVRGFAELYRIGAVPPGPKLDDTMARIESEAARMGVLVEDLLLLARLDQARPLQVAEVDLLHVVTDSAAAARAAAPDRTISVEVDPAGAPALVAGRSGAAAPGRGQPGLQCAALLAAGPSGAAAGEHDVGAGRRGRRRAGRLDGGAAGRPGSTVGGAGRGRPWPGHAR